mgnify:CR=1 FL=1
MPASLLILKDGHVGSEWLTEMLTRQPGTHFLNEIGMCMGGSLASKRAFFGSARRACACGKDECAQFKGNTFGSAPCLSAPSRQVCRVLGGSIMSVTDTEVRQWEAMLRNGSSDVLVVVQTRSNLVKWAWSFFRTGAMKRLRTPTRGSATHATNAATSVGAAAVGAPTFKEQIHRREGDEASDATLADGSRSHGPVYVDPAVLLRMVVAKQARSERLLAVARQLARLTSHRRERVLLYESMQGDMASELRPVYAALGVTFDAAAHERVPSGVPPLRKHATEDLSKAISNWDELRTALRPFPCVHQMLVDTRRRVFDDCGAGSAALATGGDGGTDPSAPCACSWRTPIADANGSRLTDESLRRFVGSGASRTPWLRVAVPRPVAQPAGVPVINDVPCAVEMHGVALVVTWHGVYVASSGGLAMLLIGCVLRRCRGPTSV